jgi:hypothetical protein
MMTVGNTCDEEESEIKLKMLGRVAAVSRRLKAKPVLQVTRGDGEEPKGA